MVPELVEAALNDPLLPLSEVAANWQIPSRLLLQHLARLLICCALPLPPRPPSPPLLPQACSLRLLVNSLEAALEGGSAVCSSGFLSQAPAPVVTGDPGEQLVLNTHLLGVIRSAFSLPPCLSQHQESKAFLSKTLCNAGLLN